MSAQSYLFCDAWMLSRTVVTELCCALFVWTVFLKNTQRWNFNSQNVVKLCEGGEKNPHVGVRPRWVTTSSPPPWAAFHHTVLLFLPPHSFWHFRSALKQKPRVKILLETEPEISERRAGGLFRGLETHHRSFLTCYFLKLLPRRTAATAVIYSEVVFCNSGNSSQVRRSRRKLISVHVL